jgi:ribosomal protein L11 methyltransferase
MGRDRVLVYGQYATGDNARATVAALRGQGWAATLRPADDDPALFAWHNRTRPVIIGTNRLIVCLPWAEFERADVPVIEINPGGAFGAGTHPTTSLLLEAIAERLRGGESVLDVGCGTGVLAIAAARLGATAAVGIDVDEAGVVATRANAERNGVGDRVTAKPTLLQDMEGSFDVIVANIGREVLVAMAPDLQRLLAPGGWIGLSGISPAQVSLLAAALPAVRMVATQQLDDWCAIIAEARAGSSGAVSVRDRP